MWDVRYDSTNIAAAAPGRIKIDRCTNVFRVFVKFQSALVADAAIERSGEWIGLDKENALLRGQDGMKGAAISVSPVSKRLASYIQKNMAIHCKIGVSINSGAAAVVLLDLRLGLKDGIAPRQSVSIPKLSVYICMRKKPNSPQ